MGQIPRMAGTWQGSLAGQPVELFFQQDGTLLTGKGVRFLDGHPDIVDIPDPGCRSYGGRVTLDGP